MPTLTRFGLVLALLLLLCLLPMPYGYYTLVRFAAAVVFVCYAAAFHRADKTAWCVAASALALLFQPFVMVRLGREVWQAVDVVVAAGLVTLWLLNKKRKSPRP